MATRLKDIADHLNISISTVSYALNGGPRSVPDDIRQRVLEAAKELNYLPNRLARSLAAGKTKTIGVLPDSITRGLTLVPYFQTCFNGIVNELETWDYDVLLYTRVFPNDPDRLVAMLLDGRVDGVILLAPLKSSSVIARTEAAHVPSVVLFGEAQETIPAIKCDNQGGMRLAVQHLASLGHRKIGHIHGGSDKVDASERMDAFTAAIHEFGLESRSEWNRYGAFTPDGGDEAAIQIFAQATRPTALVCGNDGSAVGVYRAAQRLGLRIPEDISVTGFDDGPSAQVLIPQLTTVRQPMEAMGMAAAHAVMDLIQNRPVQSQTFSTELVIRESTSRPMEVL